MAYNNTVLLGSIGSLVIAEQGGVVNLTLTAKEASGGTLANVASVSASLQGTMNAVTLVNALLGLVSSAFPAAASIVAGLQAIVDAEAANL